jgi:hypothetical protein
MNDSAPASRLQVRLREHRDGRTVSTVDAAIEPSGDLELAGWDFGAAAQSFWGDDDYEYWLTVPAEEKDRVLLALLEHVYGGQADAVSRFKDLLDRKRIRNTFVNWV